MRNVTLIKNSTGEKGEEISSAQMYLASSGKLERASLASFVFFEHPSHASHLFPDARKIRILVL